MRPRIVVGDSVLASIPLAPRARTERPAIVLADIPTRRGMDKRRVAARRTATVLARRGGLMGG